MILNVMITVNRYLAVVKAILRMTADEWDWLPSTPRIQTRRESRGRDKALTEEQVERLIAELPNHLALAARFALETGMQE